MRTVSSISRGRPEGVISVKAKHFARLREIVGVQEEDLSLDTGATVRDALNKLVVIHGQEFENFMRGDHRGIRRELSYLVNGESAHDATKLQHGDIFVIMTPVGGGFK